MRISVVEDRPDQIIDHPDYEYEYQGKNKTATLNKQYDRVIVRLAHDASGKYTKLAKKYKEIDELSKQLAKARNEVNEEVRESIEALFPVEDDILTRVVETKALTVKLAKTEFAKEEQVLDVAGYIQALEDLLGPEFTDKLKQLRDEYTEVKFISAKKSKLLAPKLHNPLKESAGDFFSKLKLWATGKAKALGAWLTLFDIKLNSLKKKINAATESTSLNELSSDKLKDYHSKANTDSLKKQWGGLKKAAKGDFAGAKGNFKAARKRYDNMDKAASRFHQMDMDELKAMKRKKKLGEVSIDDINTRNRIQNHPAYKIIRSLLSSELDNNREITQISDEKDIYHVITRPRNSDLKALRNRFRVNTKDGTVKFLGPKSMKESAKGIKMKKQSVQEKIKIYESRIRQIVAARKKLRENERLDEIISKGSDVQKHPQYGLIRSILDSKYHNVPEITAIVSGTHKGWYHQVEAQQKRKFRAPLSYLFKVNTRDGTVKLLNDPMKESKRIDELGKDTLQRYYDKADKEFRDKKMSLPISYRQGLVRKSEIDHDDPVQRKIRNRDKGLARASNRLDLGKFHPKDQEPGEQPNPNLTFDNKLPSAPKKKPTQNHRPAIWENMLGTVYAMNEEGETKYFDYDYQAANEWAGIDPDRDLRWFKNMFNVRWSNGSGDPRKGKVVLWIRALRKPKVRWKNYRYGGDPKQRGKVDKFIQSRGEG